MSSLDHTERARLDAGLKRAGAVEPQAAAEALDILCGELLRWGRVHNLTGHTAPGQVLDNLFLDALHLIPLIRGKNLLDIGSGAGFPGLVLALARPDIRVVLLEPRAKRVSFQRRVIGLLGLGGRVSPVQGRSPEADMGGELFSTVTLRAVGDLEQSLALARPYLAPHGAVLLPRAGGEAQALTQAGLEVHPYRLPQSNEERLIAVFAPESGV